MTKIVRDMTPIEMQQYCDYTRKHGGCGTCFYGGKHRCPVKDDLSRMDDEHLKTLPLAWIEAICYEHQNRKYVATDNRPSCFKGCFFGFGGMRCIIRPLLRDINLRLTWEVEAEDV